MNATAAKIVHDDLEIAYASQETKAKLSNEVTSGRRKVRGYKSAEAFRSIGEAAKELGLKTHVLRFWETKFPQITPMKRADKRRFYRPEDMLTIRAIQILLHERGMTIKGAQRYLASTPVETLLSEESLNMTPVTAGKSVRDLQDVVRNAVEGGAFKAAIKEHSNVPRERLDRLLEDLTGLKSRLDEVRKTS
ncbi:MerR family transcriptional regulator [Hirschia baltica]|uniref:Transcriptional regulator, MerR family n=1 Tax=Hirschia baltica (strain ATCC 49814 / DSM 5838 / IFAM 1418) TaxID=582402 RepID=C6XIY3_HIRBI|nr:MerR family transcriptional regulator [Hirschia baltica]ACT59078.1 transcriptional regulator, MerR family [Hirschia baltica ATCC 49814]